MSVAKWTKSIRAAADEYCDTDSKRYPALRSAEVDMLRRALARIDELEKLEKGYRRQIVEAGNIGGTWSHTR